jgi:NAD+ kinase
MKILYIPTFNKKTDIDNYFYKENKKAITEQNPEMILVSGGDGSLLHAIQDYQYKKVPFIGVAAGTLNFLMNEFTIEKIKTLKKEDLNIIKEHSLKIEVQRKRSNGSKKIVFKAIAMNDIVLGGRIMDYNSFNIKGIKEEINLKGMGLIFTTAIGSTAFYFNNGGKPIKKIGKGIVGISSIVSERKNSFDKKVKIKKEINIEIKSERNICSIYIDGNTQVFELKKGDNIIISKGPKVEIGFLDIESFKKKRKAVNNK